MRTSEATQSNWHAIVTPIVARAGAFWWAQAIYDLLADLAEVTRERDEARAALTEVADQLWSRNNRETCSGCPAEGALCDGLNVHGNCIDTIGAAAYTTTGGTVPDAQE